MDRAGAEAAHFPRLPQSERPTDWPLTFSITKIASAVFDNGASLKEPIGPIREADVRNSIE
jgi:hypothetical protein